MQGFNQASPADDDPHLRSLRPPTRSCTRRNHVCGSASNAVPGNLRLRPRFAARPALDRAREEEKPRCGRGSLLLDVLVNAGQTNAARRYPAACS